MFLHLQMRAEISSSMFTNEGETCCLQKNKARLEGYLTHEFKQLKLTVIIIEKNLIINTKVLATRPLLQ